ncbi:uncharacterized protein LOC133891312 [Phragmites australis]|uniref:uncharacterized protein LOC133891312 n=1 Tax=Phragmites australis TaxID=29695 RepID=UPI002D7909B5|nr:uncharacterized protein LOC133891312 [Phragmites australis]
MRFMCFGGVAAVVDDDVAGSEAAVAARHRGHRRGRSLSFRGKSLPGKGGKRKPSPASPLADAKKRGVDADDVHGATGASTASSVASSSTLSSAASLSSSFSSSASSSSLSGVLPPPAPAKRQAMASTSPAAGAAAMVLCLLMVVLCGRVGATLLTSTALYLLPRRWPATVCKQADDDVESPVCDAVSASEAEEETAKRKVVMEGFLVRNRKK